MSTFVPMTPPSIEGSAKAKDVLMRTRISSLRAFPLLSFLIMSTKYSFCEAKVVDTAAAFSGRENVVFFYEPFLLSLEQEERNFLLLHELLHIFLEHCTRNVGKGYDDGVWGHAIDYCVNGYLVSMNNEKIRMPKVGLYDAQYVGKSADEIYHLLLKNGGGSLKKALAESSKNGKPVDGMPMGAPSAEVKAENRQKIAAVLQSADAKNSKNMGTGAASLLLTFGEMIESKLPWNELLDQYLIPMVVDNVTYQRPSRRSGDIIFPSRTGRHIRLLFGIDSSGSMSREDRTEGLIELKGILDSFDSWTVTFLTCDTSAHVLGTFSSLEGDDFTTLNFDLIGGGGTDMNPMIAYANEMEEEEMPSVVIIFTDGFIPAYDQVRELPVLTIVTSSGNKNLVLENSEIIHMD